MNIDLNMMTPIVLSLLGILISAFGWVSRGSWKTHIEIIGGWMWLAGMLWIFLISGWNGFWYLAGSFLLAKIMMQVFFYLLFPQQARKEKVEDTSRE